MLKKMMATAMIAGGLLLTGCASVPMAAPEKDQQAKTYAVAPGKANIYIYRNESMGAAVKMPLVADGRMIGDTAAKTYLFLQAAPGPHTLISKTENDSTLELNAEAGKNYFVWQEVKMGAFAARSRLQLVDEATGKAGVEECKLVQTNY